MRSLICSSLLQVTPHR